MKASSQSPEASDTEATFHTPPRSHPLWTEGSVGSACQIIEGKRPTFVTCRIERTHSLFSIFHPDHLVRERYPTFQERRNSLQSDSLDCPSYAVDLYFRSLVKYRQESQIPPPTWRGPPKQEGSHISLQDSPTHIQLPQPVTDTYKLVYISHQARRDSDSGERSPADSQGVDIHPGPALRKARSLEHLDFEAAGSPESREHSPAKLSGTTLQGPARSLKSSTAHKDNPAHGGPDSRDRSTAHPSGLKNPSDPAEGNPPKQESDHPPKTPPKTPPVPTPQSRSEKLEAKLTPLQKRRLKTLKEKGKITKVPSSLPTLDTTSKKFPKKSRETPPSTVTKAGVNPLSEPTSPESPKSPDLSTPGSSSSEKSPSSVPTMTTVKELADALTDKLKDIGRHPTIPLPQFKGKKGEDPNDHCMKVEDYFAMFNITSDEDQKRRFLETLAEKARCWASTINIAELKSYRYDEKEPKEEKEKTFKWLFIKRFAKEGRMTHAAFEAWKNLKFDPAKDDVEEFMTTIKNLASTLAFNEEAQVMAIKSNMPRDIYGLCMQYEKLDELKKFLIELFENPRMKSAMPLITAEVETSAFSIGEFVNSDVVSATSDDIGKLKNEISALQFKVRRMMPSDSRNKPNPKPWKPEVTPPRRKGNNFRGRGFRQNDAGRRDNSSSGQNSSNNRDRNFGNGNQLGINNGNRKPFGNRGQNNGNFGGNQRGRGRGRGRFDTSPNVRRPRVASKTVNKDKGRCFYCNEFGHFVKDVPRKLRMRETEDTLEWMQIIIKRASTQIMMTLVFSLMTMMTKYLQL